MIGVRNFEPGDRVRLVEGVYEGLEGLVKKIKPKGGTFVSHIRVEFDLQGHTFDKSSRDSLYLWARRWLPATAWELVR